MDNINDYLSEGQSRLAKSDYLTAIEFFQVALEMEPENEEALLGAAFAYQKQGNIIKAKKCYYRVLSNDPEHAEALKGIEALISNGNHETIENTTEETEKEMDAEKDFRVANWGDPYQLVQKREGEANLVQKSDIYAFSGTVASLPCTVLYGFTDDKLTIGKYIFNIEHSNQNDYIYDYEELVDLLTSKYGKPTHGGKNNAVWFDDLFRDDYSDWGRAISYGHLAYDTSWETPDTEILCQLSGDNYEIKLVIQYVGKNFSQIREAASKKDKMRGL